MRTRSILRCDIPEFKTLTNIDACAASRFDIASIFHPPTPAAVQFHDGVSLGRELNSGGRCQMTHQRIAVEDIHTIFSQPLMGCPPVFGKVHRSRDMALGIAVCSPHIARVYSGLY